MVEWGGQFLLLGPGWNSWWVVLNHGTRATGISNRSAKWPLMSKTKHHDFSSFLPFMASDPLAFVTLT